MTGLQNKVNGPYTGLLAGHLNEATEESNKVIAAGPFSAAGP